MGGPDMAPQTPRTRNRLRLLERVDAGLGDLRVLRGGPAGDADAADELAADDDGDPALEHARPVEIEQAEIGPTLRDEVLEDLGGPAERHRRVRLVTRHIDAAELRAIHTAQ